MQRSPEESNSRADPEPAGPGVPAVSVGEAARRLLRGRGLGATITLGDVMRSWEEIVGPVVAAHAVPSALRAETLTVEVDGPVWATKLQFISGEIVAALTERLGEAAPAVVHARVTRRPSRDHRGHS
jgi:predicted nucleic acid-binding Zn ribbon protein